VFFWIKAVALYLASAIFAFLLSLAVSFCAVRVWTGPDDDSPALGIMMFLLFVGISGLLLPVCLGLTAELLQDKVLAQRFSWLKGLRRVLLALPMGVGLWYAYWVLLALRADARPTYWLVKMILLLCGAVVFGYDALRIRRQLTQGASTAGRQ
jgi:hypothetical protein